MRLDAAKLAAFGIIAAVAIVLWATTTPAFTIAVVAGVSVTLAVGRRPAPRRSSAVSVASPTPQLAGPPLGQILAAMHEAVLLLRGGVVAYANPAAEDLLTATPGQPLPPHLDAADGTTEITIHHPTQRILRITTRDLADGDRLIVARDVTDARRADDARRDFVANASHEMKTPVAAIQVTAETLRDAITDDPEAAVRFAGTLADEAARLSSLVQDLLDLARLDTPRQTDTTSDWSDLVTTASRDVSPSATERGLNLTTSITDGVIVRGSAEDVAPIARNLLENAIAYTPAGGSIKVSLASGQGRARLTVTDSGIGIPARDLPRIFERFYRVDRARSRQTGGTGLGLSIVRHVAEGLGGRVEATSELGHGSTFTVELPAVE